jgi:hypothetical protein
MGRRKKEARSTTKPRYRVSTSYNQHGVPITIIKHGKKGEPSHVTHIVRSGESVTADPTTDHPQRLTAVEEKQPLLALSSEQLEASPARIEAALRRQPAQECPSAAQPTEHRSAPPLGASGHPARDVLGAELKPTASGEATLTDAQLDQRLAASVREPKHHIQQRDEDGKATSPEKEAGLAQSYKNRHSELRSDIAADESWYDVVDYICEKIGIYGCFKAFGYVVGAGIGALTIMLLFGGK